VRYVVMTEAAERFRILIDAVYVEAAHRTVHRSDGIVESSEFKEIAERLRAIQLQAQRDAQAKARIDSQIAAKQELLRRRQEEVTKLADAESSADDLVKRIQELRHKVEMRVATSAAPVKSAPFEGAATLLSLKQSSDVVVLILTPYWLGIETADGHRGWVRKDDLVPLP
jgi:phosphoglycolate phosphatase-like HAD superfamily hydrolase